MAQEPLPSPGDVIAGKYAVERLLGRGGMGAVFAAQHLILQQRVALKLLLGELAESQEASTRFINEARAAAKIQGEHVARVLDIGQLPSGAPFMVLEYLEGSDLANVLAQRGPLPVQDVADYAIQALDALGQAHAAGIVHRDLKPANLFLTRRHDGASLVKVLDFGISKNLAPATGQAVTSTRALLGSPAYMSPEQLRSPRGVDARTDIWSMGVILYELLTGRTPFDGETLAEVFVSILEKEPPSVRTLRPEVPPALELAVSRCIMRDPAARFQGVRELAQALSIFASDAVRAMAIARVSAPAGPAVAEATPATSARALAPLAASSRPDPLGVAGSTAAPWSGTQDPTAAKRSRTVAVIGAVVLGLLVGVVGISAIAREIRGPASTSQPPVAAATPSVAPVPLPPITAPLALDPTAAGAQDAAAPLAATASTARPAPWPATRLPPPATATATATPPPPPSPPGPPPSGNNCNPNYYFDKDGKHFKPECFSK